MEVSLQNKNRQRWKLEIGCLKGWEKGLGQMMFVIIKKFASLKQFGMKLLARKYCSVFRVTNF